MRPDIGYTLLRRVPTRPDERSWIPTRKRGWEGRIGGGVRARKETACPERGRVERIGKRIERTEKEGSAAVAHPDWELKSG